MIFIMCIFKGFVHSYLSHNYVYVYVFCLSLCHCWSLSVCYRLEKIDHAGGPETFFKVVWLYSCKIYRSPVNAYFLD